MKQPEVQKLMMKWCFLSSVYSSYFHCILNFAMFVSFSDRIPHVAQQQQPQQANQIGVTFVKADTSYNGSMLNQIIYSNIQLNVQLSIVVFVASLTIDLDSVSLESYLVVLVTKYAWNF